VGGSIAVESLPAVLRDFPVSHNNRGEVIGSRFKGATIRYKEVYGIFDASRYLVEIWLINNGNEKF
jgi:hypothetical protein